MTTSTPPIQSSLELSPNDLPILLNEVTSMSPSNVVNFGLQLTITRNVIEGFEIRHNRDMKQCLREILDNRLKREPPLTWPNIVTALRADSVGESRLAREIEARHMPSSQPPSYQTFSAYPTTAAGRGILSSKPRLAQLKVLYTPGGGYIEIIKTISPQWKDIGDLLDFDPAGIKLEEIQANKGGEGVVSCCRAMFQFWLEGNGVGPVSWATLLTLLRNSNFPALADQVEKHFIQQ